MTEHIDDKVLKKYTVQQKLGKGAYGVVWKSIERKTGRVVALKKIFDAFQNATDAQVTENSNLVTLILSREESPLTCFFSPYYSALQRTFREIMFLQEISSHPNVIRLLNVLRADNDRDIYLVFEHMDADLHSAIRAPNVLKDVHARYVVYQILKALKYIHSAKLLHRDIKVSWVTLHRSLYWVACAISHLSGTFTCSLAIFFCLAEQRFAEWRVPREAGGLRAGSVRGADRILRGPVAHSHRLRRNEVVPGT